MKKLFHLTSSLLMIALLGACSEATITEYEYHDYREGFSLPDEFDGTYQAAAEGEVIEIPFDLNENLVWKAFTSDTSSALVCSVLTPQNIGAQTLQIQVLAHTPTRGTDGTFSDSSGRSATIEIEGYYNRQLFRTLEFNVKQAARGAYVTYPSAPLEYAAEAVTNNPLNWEVVESDGSAFNTNVSCELKDDGGATLTTPYIIDEWLTIESVTVGGDTAKANSLIKVSLTENLLAEPRTASFNVGLTATDKLKYPSIEDGVITIRQAGASTIVEE